VLVPAEADPVDLGWETVRVDDLEGTLVSDGRVTDTTCRYDVPPVFRSKVPLSTPPRKTWICPHPGHFVTSTPICLVVTDGRLNEEPAVDVVDALPL
jgi:hypothetical protein